MRDAGEFEEFEKRLMEAIENELLDDVINDNSKVVSNDSFKLHIFIKV